jgi:hypothetical protein
MTLWKLVYSISTSTGSQFSKKIVYVLCGQFYFNDKNEWQMIKRKGLKERESGNGEKLDWGFEKFYNWSIVG